VEIAWGGCCEGVSGVFDAAVLSRVGKKKRNRREDERQLHKMKARIEVIGDFEELRGIAGFLKQLQEK